MKADIGYIGLDYHLQQCSFYIENKVQLHARNLGYNIIYLDNSHWMEVTNRVSRRKFTHIRETKQKYLKFAIKEKERENIRIFLLAIVE